MRVAYALMSIPATGSSLLCLLISGYALYFPHVDIDLDSEEAEKVFLLTHSITINVSWRFHGSQALGNEPPQTGQIKEGRGSSLWDCYV